MRRVDERLARPFNFTHSARADPISVCPDWWVGGNVRDAPSGISCGGRERIRKDDEEGHQVIPTVLPTLIILCCVSFISLFPRAAWTRRADGLLAESFHIPGGHVHRQL